MRISRVFQSVVLAGAAAILAAMGCEETPGHPHRVICQTEDLAHDVELENSGLNCVARGGEDPLPPCTREQIANPESQRAWDWTDYNYVCNSALRFYTQCTAEEEADESLQEAWDPIANHGAGDYVMWCVPRCEPGDDPCAYCWEDCPSADGQHEGVACIRIWEMPRDACNHGTAAPAMPPSAAFP